MAENMSDTSSAQSTPSPESAPNVRPPTNAMRLEQYAEATVKKATNKIVSRVGEIGNRAEKRVRSSASERAQRVLDWLQKQVDKIDPNDPTTEVEADNTMAILADPVTTAGDASTTTTEQLPEQSNNSTPVEPNPTPTPNNNPNAQFLPPQGDQNGETPTQNTQSPSGGIAEAPTTTTSVAPETGATVPETDDVDEEPDGGDEIDDPNTIPAQEAYTRMENQITFLLSEITHLTASNTRLTDIVTELTTKQIQMEDQISALSSRTTNPTNTDNTVGVESITPPATPVESQANTTQISRPENDDQEHGQSKMELQGQLTEQAETIVKLQENLTEALSQIAELFGENDQVKKKSLLKKFVKFLVDAGLASAALATASGAVGAQQGVQEKGEMGGGR